MPLTIMELAERVAADYRTKHSRRLDADLDTDLISGEPRKHPCNFASNLR